MLISLIKTNQNTQQYRPQYHTQTCHDGLQTENEPHMTIMVTDHILIVNNDCRGLPSNHDKFTEIVARG